MFYSRLKVPEIPYYEEAMLRPASRWFPVVGIILGGISALASLIPLALFFLAKILYADQAFFSGLLSSKRLEIFTLPSPSFGGLFIALFSALAAILSGILASGAFHEDGLHDVCDGFGGGMSQERILEIMKDSRLGSYGSLAAILNLLVKLCALTAIFLEFQTLFTWYLGLAFWFLSLLSCAALARLGPLLVMLKAPYARKDASSKVKPLAKGLTLGDAWPGFIFALLPHLALAVLLPKGFIPAACIFLAILANAALNTRWFKRVLGGYTGDCLGSTEQLGELLYLSILAIFLLA